MFTCPDPIRIAEGTYLVRPLVRMPGSSIAWHVNSLVILGPEPVIVDTGAAVFRDEWVEQVFGLVDPHDVRWIFLSHDDPDHAGNLDVALAMCPRATLVTSWFTNLRMAAGLAVAADRERWVDDGENLELADRCLIAVRPPTFDSPATRGLYDSSTGVYWSSDAFGTPVTEPVDCVADLPGPRWEETSMAFSSLLSPWHTVVDPVKFGGWVDRIARLRPTAIASAHGPVLLERSIDTAMERMRQLPETTLDPGQGLMEDLTALFDT